MMIDDTTDNGEMSWNGNGSVIGIWNIWIKLDMGGFLGGLET